MVPSVFNLSQSAAVNGIFIFFFFSLIHIGHGRSAPTGLVCTDSSRTVVTFTVGHKIKDLPVSHLGSRVVPFALRPPSERSATFTATSASLSLAPPICSPPPPRLPIPLPPLPSLFDVVTLSPSAAAPPPPSPAAPPETRRVEWERLQREIRVRSGRVERSGEE